MARTVASYYRGSESLSGVQVTVAVAVVAALAVALRARSRLGGVTGDVLGAGVEISLAAALTVAVCLG